MSQKKVDQYKKDKANRAKIIKREKLTLAIEKAVALLVFIAAVAWIGYSVYATANANKAEETVETLIDTSALDDYINNVDTGETSDETDFEEVTEDEIEESEAEADETEETAEDETEESEAEADETEEDEE